MPYIDQSHLDLVDNAPTRYHLPHLCPYGGGEVYEYRKTHSGKQPELVLRCYSCWSDVAVDNTLTEAQIAAFDMCIGVDVLAMLGKGWLRDTPVWDFYQQILGKVAKREVE